jgi:hypothetical protein
MSDSIPPPLPQGAGYGVVIGLGLVFAVGELFQKHDFKHPILTFFRHDMGDHCHEKIPKRR